MIVIYVGGESSTIITTMKWNDRTILEVHLFRLTPYANYFTADDDDGKGSISANDAFYPRILNYIIMRGDCNAVEERRLDI